MFQTDFPSQPSIDFPDALRIFYQSIFPFGHIYRWLSYGSAGGGCRPYFSRREFSLTLQNQAFLRFQSYSSEADMKEKILSMSPLKIDIGAVYSARPSEKKSISQGSFVPVERELVFDIDMTDYDEVRTCCRDRRICRLCWRFIAAAVKILDSALRADFGFRSILWVFSGRRGVHGWVCDQRARSLDSSARKAIVSYLELVKGGSEKTRKVNLGGAAAGSSVSLHPSIKRSLLILGPMFGKHLVDEQDIFSSEDKARSFLSIIGSLGPDDGFVPILIIAAAGASSALARGILDLWTKSGVRDPHDRWKILTREIEAAQSNPKRGKIPKFLVEELVIQHSYPRLDANVTIGLNHLLKCPFCIHPDTGKICIPIHPDFIDSFDPDSVPTVSDLVKNVGQGSASPLEPYLGMMDVFLGELLATIEPRKSSAGSLDAGDGIIEF